MNKDKRKEKRNSYILKWGGSSSVCIFLRRPSRLRHSARAFLSCPGLSWSDLLCPGLTCFNLVCPGLSWSRVILAFNCIQWFSLVFNGPGWSRMVSEGLRWSQMVSDGHVYKIFLSEILKDISVEKLNGFPFGSYMRDWFSG